MPSRPTSAQASTGCKTTTHASKEPTHERINHSNASLPQTTPEQVDALVRSALGAGDAGTAQAIQNLMLIQQARVSQLHRTAAALNKQEGADSAETKAAEAAVRVASARVAGLSAAHLAAATPRPQVSSTGWALYGHVLNAQSEPAGDFTVFLVDEVNKIQKKFGFAYTDGSGYFLLNYAGGAGKPQTDGQLFVRVANKKGLAVHTSTTALNPQRAARPIKAFRWETRWPNRQRSFAARRDFAGPLQLDLLLLLVAGCDLQTAVRKLTVTTVCNSA